MSEPLTDADLAEIEGWARAYLVDWPDHPRARFVKKVAAMTADLRRLRGMKCETCAGWTLFKEGYECLTLEDSDKLEQLVGGVLMCKPDFGCNQWHAKEKQDA